MDRRAKKISALLHEAAETHSLSKPSEEQLVGSDHHKPSECHLQ